ncbi:Dilute domain-containing protein C25B8.08 [Hypsizygus marmoreus]|uniref:Dilute domain-containing protein C25B8.08 n=1 Tax=Hypsizygus marmoreus TaxID=39966 RepID=A0A369KBU9_HYPMA|nr:Dilute domain-containing protein C25B8.08 [Hypsizygus marmoreus]
MASTSLRQLDLAPEPDLHPLYPSMTHIASLLSSNSGLSPAQRAELVAHCLARACVFGELIVIQYLLSDPQAQVHVDLGIRDEDGLGLVSLAIHGFGAESDRDVEREECVRLLIAQGADLSADNAGWTPLHHAALLSPPTLVSHLMTHGCSPFAVTRRNLTPLDVVTAHSILPGRDDVALLLEEAMRGEGWTGGRMEHKRRISEQRLKRRGRRKQVQDGIGKALGISPTWWGPDSDSLSSDSESEDEEDDDAVYTPVADYSSMLVFSPPSLPHIFDSLITNFQPSLRDATPANTLYLLARFACLTCDHTWLEDLIMGATDAIEETFFNRADDVTCLVFWLYNTTIWLHLLQCDNSINEACEMLGSFDLIEEVINSVFVFIIRFAERKIDQLFDIALLDFSPLASEFDAIQFESDWSFLRPFTAKKKVNAFNSLSSGSALARARAPSSPPSPGRPLSPSQSQGTISSSTSRGFSSLRQSFARSRVPSATPLSALFPDSPPPPSPADLTTFLTALHTCLTLADINPALITQLWSQVMYWTSCEIFNRIITRKKYLCRSRAIQIGMNLGVLEEWIEQMGLPPGIQSHFLPVRDLLNWLQGLSSITEFSELVATIQTMKSINPLQMRRAVRDYKYEVNEGRMTDECIQYLTQLQKDWERHRVKLGVEAIRKEMGERDREDSISSYVDESSGNVSVKNTPSISTNSSETSGAHYVIDTLFGTPQETLLWEPIKPPPALGELLDSRYMLPLLFPSDPRMLAALPTKFSLSDVESQEKGRNAMNISGGRGSRGTTWRSRNRRLREVGAGTLQWVDGIRSAARWTRPIELEEDDEEQQPPSYASDDPNGDEETELRVNTHATPLTRKPSGRSRGRHSLGDTTPV